MFLNFYLNTIITMPQSVPMFCGDYGGIKVSQNKKKECSRNECQSVNYRKA